MRRLDRPRQLADERVLRVVGVLVLVHQEVPEPALVERRDLGEGTEQVHGLRNEVVEVERVRAVQLGRVAPEQLEEHDLRRVVRVDLAAVALDVDELVLELRDLARDGAHRETQRVGLHVLHEPLDEGARVGRVVDRETAREAELLGLAAQDAHARRVERRDPHALRGVPADELLDALAHLARRLVRERDGENLARPQLAIADEPGDAPREHARLARASARDDEERLRARLHGRELLRVEALEQRVIVPTRGIEGVVGEEAHGRPSLGRAPDRLAAARPVRVRRGPRGRGRAGRRRRRRARSTPRR